MASPEFSLRKWLLNNLIAIVTLVFVVLGGIFGVFNRISALESASNDLKEDVAEVRGRLDALDEKFERRIVSAQQQMGSRVESVGGALQSQLKEFKVDMRDQEKRITGRLENIERSLTALRDSMALGILGSPLGGAIVTTNAYKIGDDDVVRVNVVSPEGLKAVLVVTVAGQPDPEFVTLMERVAQVVGTGSTSFAQIDAAVSEDGGPYVTPRSAWSACSFILQKPIRDFDRVIDQQLGERIRDRIPVELVLREIDTVGRLLNELEASPERYGLQAALGPAPEQPSRASRSVESGGISSE